MWYRIDFFLSDIKLILVVGGIKGGSGKTTVATNLCIMRALAGSDVLLIDADDAVIPASLAIARSSLLSLPMLQTLMRN